MLAIGNEVAEGRVHNDNARWFAGRGGQTVSLVVGDTVQEVIPALKFLNQCRWVVVCGGLGPTVDDLTRSFVCRWLRCEVKIHAATLRRFIHKMRRVGVRNIPRNNELMAQYPALAKPLPNPTAGAVGFTFKKNGTRYFFLPGVPKEFRAMVERYVLNARGPSRKFGRDSGYQFSGVSESALDSELQSILPNALRTRYGIYPKAQGVDIVVRTGRPEERRTFRNLIHSKLKKYLLIEGSRTAEEVLVDLLNHKRLRLAVAESCTAGLLSSIIANVPGASKVLIGGMVAYSNTLKISLLGVRRSTLSRFGAVSPECASEMARGALNKCGADLAVSITGIAGPGGGSIEKPVGGIYFGFAIKNVPVHTERTLFSGDRNTVREKSAYFAIHHLIRTLRKT